MTTVDVARIAVHRRMRGTAEWALGIAGLSTVYVLSYRSVSGAKSAAVETYPPALRRALDLQDLTSAAGYLGATVFGIPLLVLTAVYAVTAATRAIATDEADGVLDLVLSGPVSRTALVLGRVAAAAAELAVIGIVLGTVVALLRPVAALPIGTSLLASAVVTWWLLGSCLTGVAFAISAASGHRGTTVGIAATVIGTAYLAGSFLPILHGFAWTRRLSPFAWADAGGPLSRGLQAGDCLLLAGTTALAVGLACLAFSRRDLRV